MCYKIGGNLVVSVDITSSRNSKIRNLEDVEINSKQSPVTEYYEYTANKAWNSKSMLQYRT